MKRGVVLAAFRRLAVSAVRQVRFTGLPPAALVAGLALVAAAGAASGAETARWMHVPINADKPRTVYETVSDDGNPIVHARADRSASLLMKPAAGLDLRATPLVEWRWQLRRVPQEPDVAVAAREDAAARLVFVFDGDRKKLPWTDRAVMAAADRLGSRPMPYATLMYVTSSRHPVGTVVPNPYTRRVQMLVVDAPAPGSPPQWRGFRRDVAADFRRVFGEEPGPVVAYGLMSDSDNTRSHAEALYDLPRFSAKR